MANIRIFLLRPKDENDLFDARLIWADNENEARDKSGGLDRAVRKGEVNSDPENVENLYYYKKKDKVNCQELSINDYEITSQEDDEIYITYDHIEYELTKDTPQDVK
jgi:hypothetical protein